MLNRIFVVASVTLTSTGSAVSSFLPFDTSCMKLPTQLVIKATGQGAYVRLSSDSTPATNKDVLVQGGDHVVMSVAGRRYISVLSDGASSTVSIGALSTGVSGNVGATLDLSLLSTLDPRITFSRTSNATRTDSNGRVGWAPHNLLTNSEDFEAAAWNKGTGGSIAANTVVAPDGTTTADAYTWATSTTSFAFLSQTVSSVSTNQHTFAIWLKRPTGSGNRALRLAISDTTTSTGNSNDIVVTESWQQFTFSRASGTSTGSVGVGLNTPTGSPPATAIAAGDVVQVWGAQLNVGALQSYNPTTPKNLLGYTQEFDNAAWTKTTATITANTAAGPDGYATADTVTAAAANAVIGQAWVSVTAPYTFSIWMKRVSGSGTIEINGGASWSTASITSEWQRISVTQNVTAGVPSVGIRIGTSGDVIQVWGAQLSNSASVDPYVYNPQAAPTSTAYYGPRFDYNPVTLAANGLLIEEQRTNLQTYSEQFNNAAGWGVGASTAVTTNVAVAPNGTTTANKVAETTTTASFSITAGATPVINTTYTFSVYGKAAERSWLILNIFTGVASTWTWYNISNGTLGTIGSGATASIQDVGNGWYRCLLTVTTAASGSPNAALWCSNANNSITYAGTAGNGILVWGAQVEAGSFATSYIPTVASQVTRAADNASMLGDNFATWFNASQGTFYAQFDVAATTTATGMAITSADNNATNGYLFYKGSLSATLTTYAGANSASVGNLTINTAAKSAIAYDGTNNAGVLNGASPVAITAVAVTTPTQFLLGRSYAGLQLSGHIRSISYYPTRLPNATLVSITA